MIHRPAAFALAAVTLSPAAGAAVVFDFDYSDASNDTFFSTATSDGQARRAALADTASYLSNLLSSYSATVSYEVTTFNDADTDTLASAGQQYSFSTSDAGPTRGKVEREILGGENLTSNTAFINWNGAQNFYTGEDPSGIARSESDFRSVALHELTHSLGWLSLFEADGSSSFEDTDIYSIYDASLVDGDGNPLIDGSGSYIGEASDLEGPILYSTEGQSFRTRVDSSVFDPTHLNASVDSVMNAVILSGTTQRAYTNADLAVLSGFGYTAIPEPASAAMLASGGLLVLNRRRVA